MKETDIKINKIIQELLYGGLKESRQAKKELIKEIEKMLKLEQGNTSDSSKNREFRKKTVLQIEPYPKKWTLNLSTFCISN